MSYDTREIVQITASTEGESGDGEFSLKSNLHALCTDGTVWELAPANRHGWRQLPSIPTDDAIREAKEKAAAIRAAHDTAFQTQTAIDGCDCELCEQIRFDKLAAASNPVGGE